MQFTLDIDKECKEEIIARVHEKTALINEIESLVINSTMIDTISGYLDDEIIILNISDINCFIVENDRTFAVYKDKKHYHIRRRLYEIESMLPGHFEKISKSAVANWRKIEKFKVQLTGAVDAVFTCGHIECISRRCFADLKRRYDL